MPFGYTSDDIRKFRLLKSIPCVSKQVFYFDEETGYVFGTDGWGSGVPLRQGIAGYLWLLRMEPGYFRRVK